MWKYLSVVWNLVLNRLQLMTGKDDVWRNKEKEKKSRAWKKSNLCSEIKENKIL